MDAVRRITAHLSQKKIIHLEREHNNDMACKKDDAGRGWTKRKIKERPKKASSKKRSQHTQQISRTLHAGDHQRGGRGRGNQKTFLTSRTMKGPSSTACDEQGKNATLESRRDARITTRRNVDMRRRKGDQEGKQITVI